MSIRSMGTVRSLTNPSAAPSLVPGAIAPPQPIALLRQRAWVELDLDALRHNVRQLKDWTGPGVDLMAVVKADAYGHGAIAIAQAARSAGADWLAVATIEEGGQLREAAIAQPDTAAALAQVPILVLGAIHTPDQVKALLHWRLQPTLCCPQQAALAAEVAESLGQRLPVHLKIDTGMSRLGVLWSEAPQLVRQVRSLRSLELASIYSHFATADEPDDATLRRQHRRFEMAIAQIRQDGHPLPPLHMANSAATLRDRALHYDRIRPGLCLYGLYPAPHLADTMPLRPVLSVRARITQIKTIPAGEGVSYGHRFTTDRPTRVATVGIGYADGVPRSLSGQIDVLWRGQRIRQIGTITMDQLMLDATAQPDLQPGDTVTLLGSDGGDRILAEDWADKLGTISWEILCSFRHRLPRLIQTP
ncbi:MAG: alanine racemase [Cyanobacteria bacterium]|nr:alanine racemase [Cyanobacteriota bacterium]